MAWLTKVHFLLHLLVPAPGVFLEGLVELGICAERGQKSGLVIRAAAHPAIGDARPFGDGIARAHHFLRVVRGPEEFVGVAAAAGIGRGAEHVFAIVVQSVIQPRQHPDGVAEGRVRGDILDPFPVDPDLAAVAQTLDVFLSCEGPCSLCHVVTPSVRARTGRRRRRPSTRDV